MVAVAVAPPEAPPEAIPETGTLDAMLGVIPERIRADAHVYLDYFLYSGFELACRLGDYVARGGITHLLGIYESKETLARYENLRAIIIPFLRVRPQLVCRRTEPIASFLEAEEAQNAYLNPRADLFSLDEKFVEDVFCTIKQRNGSVMISYEEAQEKDFASISRLAADFPEVKIIIGHSGVYFYSAVAETALKCALEAAKLPNVYLETSVLALKVKREALGKAPPEKLLLGTGFPRDPYQSFAGKNPLSPEEQHMAEIFGAQALNLIHRNILQFAYT